MTALAPPTDLPELPGRRTGEGPGRFAGRVALVTGAGGAIGSAVAHRLASEGAPVMLTDADPGRLEAAEAAVGGSFPQASLRGGQLDVTDPAGWSRALRAARRSLGPVDVLVHCAGVPAAQRLDEVARQEWDRVIAIDQTSFLVGLQACLPSMWAAGGGSVVALGSVFGRVASGGAFAYHAAKGALHSMVTAAAVELAPRRIRVNAVLPGVLQTELTAHLGPEYLDQQRSLTPLARLATAEDVAAAAAFLASDEADFVTGALLPVDGGFLCR